MKQKLSLIAIALIMILPIALYTIFKMPNNGAAIAASAEKPTALIFSSALCAECQKYKKVLEKVEPEYSQKITFQKIDAGKNNLQTQIMINRYDVLVVPTTVLLNKNGKMVAKATGAVSAKKLSEELDNLLK